VCSLELFIVRKKSTVEKLPFGKYIFGIFGLGKTDWGKIGITPCWEKKIGKSDQEP